MTNHLRADGRYRGADADTSALAYSIPNAAARIGISRSNLYEQIRVGEIPTIKIGARTLIGDDDLRAFLERHRVVPAQAGETA
jgi:excisionase family DNA binding protein